MDKKNLPQIGNISRMVDVQCFTPTSTLEKWNAYNLDDESSSETTITILDIIGRDWDGEGVTAKRISAALRRIGDQPVRVIINSPGGDFFEGVAIYNLLRNHTAKVTCEVIGIAASAASIIAMAADELIMDAASILMIHNTQICVCGDRNAMLDISDILKDFDHILAGVYAARSGMSLEKVKAMLDSETWFTPESALKHKLIDEISAENDLSVTNVVDFEQKNSIRIVDNLLASHNLPRNERRKLLGDIKGKQDAVPSDTQDAVENALNDLMKTIQQI